MITWEVNKFYWLIKQWKRMINFILFIYEIWWIINWEPYDEFKLKAKFYINLFYINLN